MAKTRRDSPEILADHLCDLVRELTAHRQGSGPHWIQVDTLERELRRHRIAFTGGELQEAIAIAVERHVLKTAGDPVHSIAEWQKDWGLEKRTPPIKERRRKR